MPKGVVLTEPDDYDAHRAAIFDGVHTAVKSSFPKVYGGVRMELADTAYEGPEDFSPKEQKEALLKNKFLTRRLRGTVRLFDESTGEQLDETRTTLMNVPWLSPRGSFIHGGNDYVPIHQMRLVPGPYARTMANGQFEVQFNPKPGTGMGYRTLFEPETAQFKLRVGPQMHAHMYSVLHDLGVDDKTLEKSWGPDILARNKAKYNPKALRQVYSKMVPPREQNEAATPEEQRAQLSAALERTQVLLATTKLHLPGMLDVKKRAAVQAQLRATDAHDKENLSDQFTPDLKPDELRENVNALQGKSGPVLAGGPWPARWATDQDNMGWLAWYEQYHHGRRSEDDRGQIQRWLRFRRLHLPKFINSPTPRRAFGLRNWAIDPEKFLAGAELDDLRAAMKEYKADKWSDWMAKKSSMRIDDLVAIVQFLNTEAGANISPTGKKEELEARIMGFIRGTVSPESQAMLRASAVPTIVPIKMAALAGMIRANDDIVVEASVTGAVRVKRANLIVELTSDNELDLLSSFLTPDEQ